MKLTIFSLKSIILISLFLSIFTVEMKKSTAKSKANKASTVFDFVNSLNGKQEPAGADAAPPTPQTPPAEGATATSTTTATSTSQQSTSEIIVADGTQITNTTNIFVVDLNDPNIVIENWMSISSAAFTDARKYPKIPNANGVPHQILFGLEEERYNEQYLEAEKEGSESPYNFWFKLRGSYVYYFSTKHDMNTLGSVFVERVENNNIPSRHVNLTFINGTFNPHDAETCFDLYDYSKAKYKVCAMKKEIKLKWMCSIQKYLGKDLDFECVPEDQRKAHIILQKQSIVEIKKINQPVIIIPTASKDCNEKWTYENRGKDWECICSEGKEQSPIDLPSKDDAILSEIKPLFQYEIFSGVSDVTSIEGILKANQNVRIYYDRGAIRIHHANMGKIVQLDGTVFKAEEIVFHTPSEHTINGQRLDMEMQVIHYGISKGDIAKQAVLSFLFKKKPSVYNKFIDKLDFFNLPNPVDTFKDITNDLFIPNVFYNSDDDDIPVMRPFSFYTYDGSITSPPCTERTIHYVTADALEISGTVIELFKEALRRPDMISEKGDFIIPGNEGDLENFRETQSLNGRGVYIFDHVKFNCPDFKPKTRHIEQSGHYEKREITVSNYVYVSSNEPSGLAGSLVVPEKEAKGETEK